ncbi:MAG: hypothetical protein IJ242_01665 [Clostridia bacterium]|nr:hypothetical protein [Clostridia bacterium]
MPRTAGQIRWICRFLLAGICICMVLLICLQPEIRHGTEALLNRLFEASEHQNAYTYVYFPGASPAGIPLAALVLITAAGALFILTASFSRLAAGFLVFMTLTVLQSYFGLSFPAWIQVLIFGAAGFLVLRVRSMRAAAYLCLTICLTALLISVLSPGVHMPVEAASEWVRDWLGRNAEALQTEGLIQPDERLETRHVSEKSIVEGNKEARGTEGFRLIQIEKMRISRPDWFSLLRTALMMLALILMLVLPFLPFVLLNRRREQTRVKYAGARSADLSEVMHAVFTHICDYLRFSGLADGNRPCREWQCHGLPDEFGQAFRSCAIVWERTMYGGYLPGRPDVEKAERLLEETEQLLYEQADFVKRFRMRTIACLHE